MPFDTDGTALATDAGGRVWLAVEGQPRMAVFDPRSGQVRQFQYAAPSLAAHPAHPYHGMRPTTPAPGAVWLTHIAAMVTDAQGHLWYVRMGRDQIEMVAA